MDRKHLTVYDPDAPEGDARLALVLTQSGGRLVELHGKSQGRFARVYLGYSGAGRVRKPVAVKVERHELPPGVGQPKFASEYLAQCAVHRGVADGQPSRVVRLEQPWGIPDDTDCDDLPPTLVCRRSRRLFAPRCPCGSAVSDDTLWCLGGCSRPTDADWVERVKQASGCGACGGGCDSHWLASRRCKLIVLELLDVDLGEYVRWHGKTPPTRLGGDKHAAHAQERANLSADPVSREMADLNLFIGLFLDAVRGVDELHRRRIVHLDLKPANLCLALDGAAARLKLIDLGQAIAPTTDWRDVQNSIRDDAERRLRDPVYSAPEQYDGRFVPAVCGWRPTANGCRLRLPAGHQPTPRPGDWCYLTRPGVADGFHRVVAADPRDGTVTAWPIAPAAAWPDKVNDPPTGPEQPAVKVMFVQQAGESADVFALGMVLFFLLTRGRDDLRGLRSAVGGRLDADLAGLTAAARFRGRPARVLADELVRRGGPLAAVASQLKVTPEPLQGVVLDLVGVALRAVCRVPGLTYTPHRGTCPAGTLDDLTADVKAARTRLRAVALGHELNGGRVAGRRRDGLKRLRDWLAARPSEKPGGRTPAYSRDRLCEVFDRLDGTPTRDAREFEAVLDLYGRNRGQLAADLDLFARELDARMLTADRVHPVVDEVIRHLLADPRGSAAGQALLAAREKYEELCEAIGAMEEGLIELAVAAERADRKVWMTDDHANAVEAVRTQLAALAARAEAGAAAVTARLADWHALQERPLAEWRRLDQAEAWQRFAAVYQNRLEAARLEATRWGGQAARLPAAGKAVADQLTELFVIPWRPTRRRYRWSARGLWRRLVGWWRRQPVRVPVPVPAAAAGPLRQAVVGLRAVVRQAREVPAARLAARPPVKVS